MRYELKKLKGHRQLFVATFDRIELKRNPDSVNKDRVCLLDLKDEDNNVLTDHIWVSYNKKFQNIKLRQGNKISFIATVVQYSKKVQGKIIIDFGLNYTTKVKVI